MCDAQGFIMVGLFIMVSIIVVVGLSWISIESQVLEELDDKSTLQTSLK